MRDLARWERRIVELTAGLASGRGASASLLVLIFHRVLESPDPLLPDEPDRTSFAAQIQLLAQSFTVLPLQEAAVRLSTDTLPRRSVSITFDDGYANNLHFAAPIMLAAGVPATVFVSPGFLDGGRMFNDSVIEAIRRAPKSLDLTEFGIPHGSLMNDRARVACYRKILGQLKFLEPAERERRIAKLVKTVDIALPDDLMLTSEQLRSLHRKGFEIGAHTMHHPILCSTPDHDAEMEIRQSRNHLECLLQSEVRSFAYPNGLPGRDYAARHVEMARRTGFTVAVSTAWGASHRNSDPLQLPRVAPWDRDPLRYGLRLVRAYRERRFSVAP